MRLGYKWIRPTNPAEGLQDAKLREIGLNPASADVFCDRASQRRLKAGADPLPELTRAIMSLHPGDELCIAYSQCFGASREDAVRRLATITRFDAALYVINSNLRVKVIVEMADTILFMSEREIPFGPQQTQAARDEWMKHQRAERQRRIKRIQAIWNDPTKTILDVAKEVKVSRFTLSKWQKAGLLPPKPRGVR